MVWFGVGLGVLKGRLRVAYPFVEGTCFDKPLFKGRWMRYGCVLMIFNRVLR